MHVGARYIPFRCELRSLPGQFGLSICSDQAPVLCKHFEDFPEHHFQGKKVVEVGSGTGLVGIFVAQLGNDCFHLLSHLVINF
jgi:16S rRNA G527 N7-methylase RsmG